MKSLSRLIFILFCGFLPNALYAMDGISSTPSLTSTFSDTDNNLEYLTTEQVALEDQQMKRAQLELQHAQLQTVIASTANKVHSPKAIKAIHGNPAKFIPATPTPADLDLADELDDPFVQIIIPQIQAVNKQTQVCEHENALLEAEAERLRMYRERQLEIAATFKPIMPPLRTILKAKRTSQNRQQLPMAQAQTTTAATAGATKHKATVAGGNFIDRSRCSGVLRLSLLAQAAIDQTANSKKHEKFLPATHDAQPAPGVILRKPLAPYNHHTPPAPAKPKRCLPSVSSFALATHLSAAAIAALDGRPSGPSLASGCPTMSSSSSAVYNLAKRDH